MSLNYQEMAFPSVRRNKILKRAELIYGYATQNLPTERLRVRRRGRIRTDRGFLEVGIRGFGGLGENCAVY